MTPTPLRRRPDARAARRRGARASRGTASSSSLVLVALAVLGISAFTALGGAFETAIAGGAEGGVPAPAAQAGEAEEPSGSGPSPGGSSPEGFAPSADVLPVNQAAAAAVGSDASSVRWDELPVEGEATNAWRGQCGLNPLCHVASLSSRFVGDNLSRFGGWISEHVGDVPVLGPIVRGAGGLIDGVWDGLFEIARGIKELGESVLWDFAVEDVILGTGRGLAGTLCKAVTFGQACEDSSWNPIKSTTNSVGHFVTSLPNVRHVVGDALHNLSICVNPVNEQKAEDRGHACGSTLLLIADVVLGAKGASRVARARLGTSLADDAAEVADDVARGTRAARCPGGVCTPGSGACFTAGTPVHTEAGAQAIETLALGDRVTVLGARSGSATQVNADTWLRYSFEMPNPEVPGTVIEVETLRPAGTFDGALVGTDATVRLDFAEWGISGDAHLTQVAPVGTLAAGDGFVVLSTFQRSSDDVLRLSFEGTGEVIEATGTHRFWSVTREAWVPARRLEAGERLRTSGGEVTLLAAEPLAGTHRVFNFEVELEHTYLVGELGLFTHNQCQVGAEVLTEAADGGLTFGKVADVYRDGTVRLEVRTRNGLVSRTVRVDELFQFPSDWSIGARRGIRAVVTREDDALLVRVPGDVGNTLDNVYRATHARIRGDFYDWFVDDRPINPGRLRDILERGHRDAAGEYRGNGGIPNTPGRFHTENGLSSRSPWLRELPSGLDTVEETLRRAGVSEADIARLKQDGPVRVRDVPEQHLPANANGRHLYPNATSHDAYLDAAARRLETIRTMNPNKPAFVNELADYFHTMANARVFGQVNNSLWMDQVNALLRTMGHPGIPHGNLDFVALAVDHETFRAVFLRAVRDAAGT